MEKFFNTAGPNQSDIHYEIDPLSRLDLDEVLLLIRQRKYLVLHTWKERLWHEPRTLNGHTITVWGM